MEEIAIVVEENTEIIEPVPVLKWTQEDVDELSVRLDDIENKLKFYASF